LSFVAGVSMYRVYARTCPTHDSSHPHERHLSSHRGRTHMITGAREKNLFEAADTLVNARRAHTPIAELPPDLQPTSLEEAALVHTHIAKAYGEIGGWKIGAPTADAIPFFAP